MKRRVMLRAWALVGLPLALFSASPSVQWCSGPWPVLTEEQFAACLASEFTGCTAEVDCALPSCESSNASVSCPPPLACEDAIPAQEAEPCGEPGPGDRAPSAAPEAARAFCLGNPAGGFGLRPVPDDSAGPDAGLPVATLASLEEPAPERTGWIAAPDAGPRLAPRSSTAPIRGPPSA